MFVGVFDPFDIDYLVRKHGSKFPDFPTSKKNDTITLGVALKPARFVPAKFPPVAKKAVKMF